MVQFELLHPRMTHEALGLLPEMLSEYDPAPARQQFHEHYSHGGGWDPFEGFRFDPTTHAIKYPGDPAHKPLARATLRDETIYFYEHSWVAIVQLDGAFEIARMD